MINLFKASSISSIVKNFISTNNSSGILINVFKRSVNIKFDGFLLTISDRSQGNLPNGILCDFSNVELREILTNGDIFEIDKDYIFKRNHSVEIFIRSAKIWAPEFSQPLTNKYFPNINANIEFISKRITDKSINDGLVPLFKYLPSLFQGNVPELMSSSTLIQKGYESLHSIITSIRYGNTDLLIKGVGQLSGLGIGLTPSGDDILTGLLATLIITLDETQKQWINRSLKKILPEVKALTTEVAFNYYEFISKGMFPERFSNLISKIICIKESSEMEPYLEKMYQWGKTSGYEIILGIILGFMLAIEIKTH